MMLKGTNLTYTKDYNSRIVFETVRLEGPISRAEIARQTGLTAQTVSNIVSRLLTQNLLEEGKKTQKGRGAPSTTLGIHPEGAYSIGLDFNRDHLTGILVNLLGEVVGKIYYEIDSPTPEEAIDLMSTTIEELSSLKNIDSSNIIGVGVGFPGPMEIDKNDTVSNVVNPKAFPNWNKVPVVSLLQKHIDVPIFLENNASAAAIGERWYGIGRNILNFHYIFFGAGLGGGLIINGELVDGAHANAGEIGYLPTGNFVSPLCESDQPHIGEHFNLSRLYKWLEEKSGKEIKRPQQLESLLNSNNKYFNEWIELGTKILAPSILAIEYLVDPNAIIIGGRLPLSILELLQEKINVELSKIRILENGQSPKLICSTTGIDAVSLGAATLPMFDLLAAQSIVLNKK